MAHTDEWTGALEDVRRTFTARGRERLGCFSIEGTRLHQRALRAGVRVETALLAADLVDAPSERVRGLLAELDRSGCRLLRAPRSVIDELTRGRSIGAIVGLVRRPPAPDLKRLLRDAATHPAVLLVALDVDDPGNIGALVRTGLAGGATAFVGVGCSDPFHPKAVRTSMGSLFKLPLARFENPRSLFEALRELDVESVGAVSSGGEALPCAAFVRPRVAMILGGEAFGLDRDVIRRLDRRMSIPMSAEVDSFSVNAAAAILLYEIRGGRLRTI